jgi:hypothetical protein
MPKLKSSDMKEPRRNELDRLFRARFSKKRAGDDAFYKVKVDNPDQHLHSHARKRKQEADNVER